MTSKLPAPLSPPDCDLRGYIFMPLFGHRLFSSSFNDQASDAEFRTAVRLWWAAWQQCPAGSLPDDDAALARMADFGRNVKGWRRVRENALHGFQLCNDGRLYHPLLCAEAQDAFERRRKERDRKAKMRDANRLQTLEQDPLVPRAVPGPVRALSQGQAQDVPADRTGQDRTGKEERQAPASCLQASRRRVLSGLDTSARIIRHINPAVGDPPETWLHLADRLPDGSPKVELSEPIMVDGRTVHPRPEDIGRPIVAGVVLDQAAAMVCAAAGIHDVGWRGDWRPLIEWLRDGHQLPAILATIRRVASRPDYRPPGSLRYFDRPIRENLGRSRQPRALARN